MDPSSLCVQRLFIFWMILCRTLSENCEHSYRDVTRIRFVMTYSYTAFVDIHAVILEPAGGSVAVCVHDKIVITCTVSVDCDILWWTLPGVKNGSDPEQEFYAPLSSTGQLPADMREFGDFVLQLESNSPLASTATLNDTDPENNGTLLVCSINDNFNCSLPEGCAAITILVKGIQNKQVVCNT